MTTPRSKGSSSGGRTPGRNMSSQVRQLRSVGLGFGGWLVDPGLGRSGGWFRPAAEPFWVGVVGGGEGVLAFLVDGVGGAEVNRRRCVPATPSPSGGSPGGLFRVAAASRATVSGGAAEGLRAK